MYTMFNQKTGNTGVGVRNRARRGFTLVQLLVVMGIIAALAAVTYGVFGRGRATARRGQCDMRLKAIAVALDAFAQENGHYPDELQELAADKYLQDAEMLRCPSDHIDDSKGYAPYYILRATRSDPKHPELINVKELPILVCPFHEDEQHGMQAFAGTYTKQFGTRPAVIQGAVSAWVTPLGKSKVAATSGMPVRGGDKITTDSSGKAALRFADGSVCELPGNSDITVLQSFVVGPVEAPLYTLIKQTLGVNVKYTVHHGSKFDVVTPTATAGAQGTVFTVTNRKVASETASGELIDATTFALYKDPALRGDEQLESKVVVTDGRDTVTMALDGTSSAVVETQPGGPITYETDQVDKKKKEKKEKKEKKNKDNDDDDDDD
jgi:type II secretory pathway pseudopilin PulG